jgi:hypothetical protein
MALHRFNLLPISTMLLVGFITSNSASPSLRSLTFESLLSFRSCQAPSIRLFVTSFRRSVPGQPLPNPWFFLPPFLIFDLCPFFTFSLLFLLWLLAHWAFSLDRVPTRQLFLNREGCLAPSHPTFCGSVFLDSDVSLRPFTSSKSLSPGFSIVLVQTSLVHPIPSFLAIDFLPFLAFHRSITIIPASSLSYFRIESQRCHSHYSGWSPSLCNKL